MNRFRTFACTAALVGAGLVAHGARAPLWAEEDVLWEDTSGPGSAYWCGPGPGAQCKSVSTQRCAYWTYTTIGGGAGPAGGNVTGTRSCEIWVTTTLSYYWTPGPKPGE